MEHSRKDLKQLFRSDGIDVIRDVLQALERHWIVAKLDEGETLMVPADFTQSLWTLCKKAIRRFLSRIR
uniref:Uncharacterized protein n=1 Tax=Physcomitrium patens TaxID=3218 RepID=A0A7I4CNX9_PHYPA